jgi:hypothetical protein
MKQVLTPPSPSKRGIAAVFPNPEAREDLCSMLRKQYHFRTIRGDLHAWDIHRLIRLSRHLVPVQVRLEDISELDENWWYKDQDVLGSGLR